MSINHGCTYVGMTKQLLDCSNVFSLFQEVCGETVTQGMTCCKLCNSGLCYGYRHCFLLILVGTGFIACVVWSFALSYQMLRTHSASDTSFWREAFYSQAKLLRLVPLWYCAPLFAGATLFVAPTAPWEFLPFLFVTAVFGLVFAGIIWINRRAAACIDDQALQLV